MRSIGSLLARIPLYWLFRTFDKPTIMPFNYTLSITYRCNSRCKTCYIWRIQHRINPEKELHIDEWTLIIKSIGKSAYWITISGGEPFLRKDLIEIIQLIAEHSKPAIINIPTNAILSDICYRVAEIAEVLKKPGTILVINLSLDGVGKTHDLIRGVPGNWERFLKNYEALKALKEDFHNLVVGVHTVISKWNVKSIPEIVNYVLEILQPDQYIAEVAEVRNEMENWENPPTPDIRDLRHALDYLIKKSIELLKKRRGLPAITEAFRIEYYKYVRDLFLGESEGMKSYAGYASCQISPLGDVWECAVYATKMGNLREYDYDFKKLWKSKNAYEVRKKVKLSHKCPLANEAYSNMLLNPRMIVRVLLNILKYKI